MGSLHLHGLGPVRQKSHNGESLRIAIGLEEAETFAEQQRALGLTISVIDPNIHPGDYVWRCYDADISIVFYAEVAADYLIRLVCHLLLAKAGSIQFLEPMKQSVQTEVAA